MTRHTCIPPHPCTCCFSVPTNGFGHAYKVLVCGRAVVLQKLSKIPPSLMSAFHRCVPSALHCHWHWLQP